MATKTTNDTPEKVESAVSSVYAMLLDKRKQEREEKEIQKIEKKEKKKEEKNKEKEKDKSSDNKDSEDSEDAKRKLSKKERRQAEIDNWKTVVIGLTGDDLEYSDEKTKKKKYRKWIDEETTTGLTGDKPKKPKKKNYQKEFAPELKMLQNLVADQNRFTADLQKRFQQMIGPNLKDASPLNKTEVELASVLNNSRSNALGVLNAIGSVKKTIADLYLRQKKQDYELNGKGGSDIDTTDLGLLGSSLVAQMGGSSYDIQPQTQNPYQPMSQPSQQSQPINNTITNASVVEPSEAVGSGQVVQAQAFDPDSWDGDGIDVGSSVLYESIPHEVVVEYHPDTQQARFKAVRSDTGEELVDCPVPTSDPSKLTFNEEALTVKGQFDEIYKLEIVK